MGGLPRINTEELVFVEAKPKWYVFARAVKCPYCGDVAGHAGISQDGKFVHCVKCQYRAIVNGPKKTLPFEPQRVSVENGAYEPVGTELEIIHTYISKVFGALGNNHDSTIRYFTEKRGFDRELAEHMYRRGYQLYTPSNIVLPTDLETGRILSQHPVFSLDRKGTSVSLVREDTEGLIFPLYTINRNYSINLMRDLRFRYIEEKKGRGKYKWLKKISKGTMLYARPKYSFVEGVIPDALLIVEGEIKAEVASFTLGYDTVGLTSGGLLRYVEQILGEVRTARPHRNYDRIIIASDMDVYKTNSQLAVATIKGYLALREAGYMVTFFMWPTAPASKGIDDFLVEERETPFEGHLSDWLKQCSAEVSRALYTQFRADEDFQRYSVNSKMVTILDAELDSLSARYALKPVQVSDDSERIGYLTNLFYKQGHNIVVDTSATGVGKTYGIAENYEELLEAGARRVVYISQSPLNPPIPSMHDWPILLGRSQFGYVKVKNKYRERTPEEAAANNPPALIPANCVQLLVRELGTSGMFEFVSHYCNELCPYHDGCPFVEQRKNAIDASHLRTSKQSYFPLPGDLVVIDERTTLAPFTDYIINEETLRKADYYIRTNLGVLERAFNVPQEFIRDKLAQRLQLLCNYLLNRIEHWRSKGVEHVASFDIRRKIEIELLRKDTAMGLDELLRGMEKFLDFQVLQQGDRFIPKKEVENLLLDADLTDGGVPKRFVELKKALSILMLASAVKGSSGVSLAYAGGILSLRYRDVKLQEAILDAAKQGTIKLLVLDATASHFEYQNIMEGARIEFVAFQKEEPANKVKKILITGLGDTYQTSRPSTLEKRFTVISKIEKRVASMFGQERPISGVLVHKRFEGIAREFFPSAVGHWHLDERGSNAYFEAGCNVMHIAGAPLPNLAVLVADTEVLFRKTLEPGAAITAGNISDADFLRVLKTHLDSAYTQAEGRLRANRRPDETLLMFLYDASASYVADEIVDISELLTEKEIAELNKTKKKGFRQGKANIVAYNKRRLVEHIKKDMQYVRKGRAYPKLGGFYANALLFPELSEREYYKKGFPEMFSEEVGRYFNTEGIGPLLGDLEPELLRHYYGFLLGVEGNLTIPIYTHIPTPKLEAVFGFEGIEPEVIPMAEAARALANARKRNKIVNLAPGSDEVNPFGTNIANHMVLPNPTEQLEEDTFFVPNLPDALRALDQLKNLVYAEGYDYLQYEPPNSAEEHQVMASRLIALDIETTKAEQTELRLFLTGTEENKEKPNVAKDVIRIISITHIPTGVTYVFDMWKVLTGATKGEASRFFQTLQKILNVSLVMGHNLTFDISYLMHHYKLEVPNPFCTFVLMHYLEAALYGSTKAFDKKHSLQKLVEFYLHKPLPKDMQKSNWGIPTLTLEQKHYAAADTQIYRELYPVLKEELKSYAGNIFIRGSFCYIDRLLGVLQLGDKHIAREMLTLVPLSDMAAWGTPIDKELLGNLLVDRKLKLDEIASELVSLGLNGPTRNSQVFRWLTSFGIPEVEENLLNLDYQDPDELLDMEEAAEKEVSGDYKPSKNKNYTLGNTRRKHKNYYTVGEAPLKNLESYAERLAAEAGTPDEAARYEEFARGIRLLLEYRSVSKDIAKLKELREYSVESRGELRIHNALISFGTATGRMSSREPNLQNISRGSDFRKLIAVSKPDRVLVGADFPQIELRIAARLTKDPVMLNSFFSGIDLHKVTAGEVSGVPVENVTKEQRQQAKAVNFGFLYGMGPATMKEYAKQNYGVRMTLEEAEQIREKYFKLYAGLQTWHDTTRNQAKAAVSKQKGTDAKDRPHQRVSTQTITGRTVSVCIEDFFRGMKTVQFSEPEGIYTSFDPAAPLPKPRKEPDYNVSAITRRLLNYADQGTGADMIKDALIEFYGRIREENLEAHVVNVVHDEVLVECLEKDKEKVMTILKEAMQTVAEEILSGLPVPVDVACGKTWQDCH